MASVPMTTTQIEGKNLSEDGETSEQKYDVGISRDYSHTGSVIVTARSPEEAQEKAVKRINDIELKLGALVPGTDEVLYVEEM